MVDYCYRCISVCAYACASVCVCVCEREIEREKRVSTEVEGVNKKEKLKREGTGT